MNFYPLLNTLRISLLSSIFVFFIGIFLAFYASKLPKVLKGIFDILFTIPLVLPPTVLGYFLLLIFGLKRPIGMFLNTFGIRFVMTWYGGILSAIVVSFPLMYRSARSAFDSVDKNILYAGKTLGLSDFFIFWKILLPNAKFGVISGFVLSFARALGEYGATSMLIGYTPNKTATIATTVYQLWRIGDEKQALFWILLNIFISVIVLLCLFIIEQKNKSGVNS